MRPKVSYLISVIDHSTTQHAKLLKKTKTFKFKSRKYSQHAMGLVLMDGNFTKKKKDAKIEIQLLITDGISNITIEKYYSKVKTKDHLERIKMGLYDQENVKNNANINDMHIHELVEEVFNKHLFGDLTTEEIVNNYLSYVQFGDLCKKEDLFGCEML